MVRHLRVNESAFISETAYVIGDVEIGENSSVWPGAVIRADLGKITIGKNSVIEDNCIVHSGTPSFPPVADVIIGENVIIGHGAVSNARRIGDNVLIGMNSTILHDVEIGEYSIIAAGCVVKEKMKIPEGHLWLVSRPRLKENFQRTIMVEPEQPENICRTGPAIQTRGTLKVNR